MQGCKLCVSPLELTFLEIFIRLWQGKLDGCPRLNIFWPATGIDEEDWNPSTDKHIPAKFSVQDFSEGKTKNKKALQEELGLPVRPEVPLIGFIGRLDYQKGADLVLAAAPWLIQQDCQIVCLGTGDSGLEV